MANGGDDDRIANPGLLEAARQHPLYTTLAVIAVAADLLLVSLNVLHPVAAGFGLIAIFALAVIASLAERVRRDIAEGRGVGFTRPFTVIVWVFTLLFCVASAAMVLFGIIYLYNRTFEGELPPPSYGFGMIDIAPHTRITDTGLFSTPSTLKEGSPEYQSIITMNKFPEWLEAGSSPPKGFKNQRLVFAVSSPRFSPPYRNIFAHVSAGPYQIAEGVAFLVSDQEGTRQGVPVRSFRQLPFRIENKKASNGNKANYINQINITSPRSGEKLLLVLRLESADASDISSVESFPISIEVEQSQ